MRVYLSIQRQAVQEPKSLPPLWRKAATQTLRTASRWTLPAKLELSLLLTNDAGIRELNRDHRGKDAATDVLSFPAWEEQPQILEDGQALPLGDIVISLEHAAAQAAQYGHSLEREAVFLFVHGLLHLLGYDHELGEAAETEMFALQEQIMRELGLRREE